MFLLLMHIFKFIDPIVLFGFLFEESIPLNDRMSSFLNLIFCFKTFNFISEISAPVSIKNLFKVFDAIFNIFKFTKVEQNE